MLRRTSDFAFGADVSDEHRRERRAESERRVSACGVSCADENGDVGHSGPGFR